MPPGVPSGSDRLTVAVDATPLLGNLTGVGRFCDGALGALAQRPEIDVNAFAVTWRRRRRLPPLVPRGVRVDQRAMPARPLHAAWVRFKTPPVEWFVGRADVVHGTNFVVPPARRAARVVTVHDLTAVRFPELCDRSTLGFPHQVRRAAAEGAWIHTPSRFVADEVVAEFGVEPARVRVVAHGIPGHGAPSRLGLEAAAPGARPAGPGTGSGSSGASPPVGARRYILAVGTVEPRKDYPGLVRAFTHVAGAMGDVALVVAGADGWGADAFHDAREASPFRRSIVQLGYVTDDALAQWLAGAAVLAFPSVYEGFGFPPLEAMAQGVPVVATAGGAVPEVVGDAAVLVPPGDCEALAGALTTVLGDDEARAALIERGRRRAGEFTWEACGAGLAGLYTDASSAR